ncbi:hypothetical protein [Dehalogenimonas alkenigignens]|uniref:hypothetical protein n=1 Tax=Dehalogenimonas alkenigignens TaxID=1217799 RepID=UPI000D581D3C|nr:hypothetical protein [Dehalogenimonas alkenigignens]PVV83521.1 hypothetical protein DD509_06740 [Dehalogenimonas alkenigignens]
MRPQWLVWIGFTYIVGQMMCIILEGAWIGDPEQSFINAMTGFTAHQYTDSLIGNIGITIANVVTGLVGFFTYGVPRLLLWDYSFLESGGAWMKWFLLYPINLGTVFGLILTFKR